ncbi:cytochrome P450 [Tribonema minus]|uniref:Cytochrome P450 n=1 Tax=Tribonema minus TaxID=303371 RepID=A0A835ZEV7_9STRA|nr:cytochrome P450 [Tribonema minus]
MDGFDWQLERARRALEGPAFSPFRMDFWRPVEDESEIGVVTLWDTMYILLMNVAQKFGWESVDGAPVAEVGSFKGSFFTFLQKVASGRLEDLAGGPLFLLLEKYFHKYGPVYKLAFGPRSFIVVSDPVMAKHLLKSNVGAYDKGVLASILEPIMGKGLIPADPQTWKVRRRAIVPGFHKRWLNRMMRLFAECNEALLDQVGHAADEGRTLDMEEKFCSVSLDIIGRAVFNYDFGSTNKESPAVYRVLREAEHRSSSFIPYWKLPFATQLLASQVEFSADMRLLNDVLDELISKAVATQQVADVEELESRDLDVAEDPSLLRFLIDMRGEDTTSKQLRDDLMTMLIAGHETTAAVLTWTLFNLAQNPELTARVQAEIDAVLGPDRLPEFDDLAPLQLTRLALVEALRLYPEPPVLIRRALREDALPPGGTGTPIRLPRGSDVFISTWNLHRSPALWDAPQEYNPERFMRPHSNPAVTGWNGYDPKVGLAGLYPNEIASDFAFLPFGGGQRKCVGDQFALMEATVTLALLLRRFDLSLAGPPEATGMVTGATIHTANGLMMRARRREPSAAAAAAAAAAAGVNGHHHHRHGGAHHAAAAAAAAAGAEHTVNGQGGKCPF